MEGKESKVLTFEEFMKQEKEGATGSADNDGTPEESGAETPEAGLPGGPEPKEDGEDSSNLSTNMMDDADSEEPAA